MNTAQELIQAVQSLNPATLRAVIAKHQNLLGFDFSQVELGARHRYPANPVNARINGRLDLTALHVAAKAYSAYRHKPHMAKAFDDMVQILLEAGANPYIEAGKAKGSMFDGFSCGAGLTVAQVCDGHLPPALASFIGEHCDDNKTNQHDADLIRLHPTTVARTEARIAAFRERNGRDVEEDDAALDEACYAAMA